MDKYILFSLPGNSELTKKLSTNLAIEIGKAEIRTFPDKESYIRIHSKIRNKTVFLVCTLAHPNNKLLPLVFMAKTLKELGADKICLVSPYLAYMRQDKRFHSGEAVTSMIFAQLLSSCLDGMITLDPHLHRIHQLSKIYTMSPLLVLHATKNISEWISLHIKNPILIGPDEESRQWISEIAHFNNLPYVIAQKKRLGDKHVVVSLPEIENSKGTAVLVDDIISSGASMLDTLKQVINYGFKNSICIGVHALFNLQTKDMLLNAGAQQIITCNTIRHSTNQIDISNILANGLLNIIKKFNPGHEN
ncbi:ribose-phosphate pyrophosphokinase [Legionella sainthelensi]|uniref:ribose-phosphate diphosphokinase n=1 Tax=Legionella sainthelensi TaxID=28087 RepID=A0A0W0YT78_9GAMM|nr:ribose-phosphate diphosphokinase [Legionella sainthelensi]KTD59747.1 ribose-phosphate pyrophosphokinase [Legionella sainthelensi]VEH31682.1 ribose-phosphate pyrophosphokinase [Legionella sainthelensi]